MDRLALTEAYRSLGAIECGQILLEAGIRHPAEQITIITQFVTDGLGSAVTEAMPHRHDASALKTWSRARLLDSAGRWPRDPLDQARWLGKARWMVQLVRSMAVIDWNPFREFGTLLLSQCGDEAFRLARIRLVKHGFGPSMDMLPGLKYEFACERLPKAMRSFDPAQGKGREAKWLSSIFYRFVLQALIADSANRRHLSFLDVARTEPNTPEDNLIHAEEERLKKDIPSALEALTPMEQRAIRLYFGERGREATLAEIGDRLGISEYRARETVTAALAGLAVRLGVQGALDDDEYAFATALFGGGMNPEAAARARNLSVADMRRRIVGKFRQTLRRRTSRAGPAEEEMMIIDRNEVLEFGWADSSFRAPSWHQVQAEVVGLLQDLRDPPRLRSSESGMLVTLGGHEYSLALVARALDKETVEKLESRNVPLAWLLAGADDAVRPEISSEALADREHVRGLRNRHWQVAAWLHQQCKELHRGRLDEAEEHVVERVSVTLIAVSQALENALADFPADRDSVTFTIAWSPDGVLAHGVGVTGRWEGRPEEETLDMHALILDRARMAGGLPQSFAEILALVTLRALSDSGRILPGFEPAPAQTPTSIALSYHLPVLGGA